MFYNCISLSYIPDLDDWNLQNSNPYLIFFNCISLAFLPYEKGVNVYKYDNTFLGLLITKHLKYNNEIIIKNIFEDKGYINLFGNKYIIKKKQKEIMIIDGKNKMELIAFYKDEIKDNEDKLIIFYRNQIKYNNRNEIEIKLRIINKREDMNSILKNKDLDLSKWNTNNVADISYLFYGCKSFKYLPDISNWKINNVKNIECLFYDCESLISIPDISKWDIKNISKMNDLFNGCKSLKYLPDISKWNTNNITTMNHLFYGCKSLKILPDISKWKTNYVTNIEYLFYECESLILIPDISKWNIKNVSKINDLFNSSKYFFPNLKMNL